MVLFHGHHLLPGRTDCKELSRFPQAGQGQAGTAPSAQCAERRVARVVAGSGTGGDQLAGLAGREGGSNVCTETCITPGSNRLATREYNKRTTNEK